MISILERNLPLTPGQDYVLSFAAKFDRIETNAVQVRVYNLTTLEDLQADGSWAVGGHAFNFALTTSYQVFSIPFTVDPGFAPTDDLRVVLRHRLASAVGRDGPVARRRTDRGVGSDWTHGSIHYLDYDG